jgi:hypothetical protein
MVRAQRLQRTEVMLENSFVITRTPCAEMVMVLPDFNPAKLGQ